MSDPYFDDDDQPILRDSYTSFIDELGTSDATGSMDNASLRELVAATLQVARLVGPSSFGGDGKRILTFSDNVSITTPGYGNKEQDQGELQSILDSCATYQLVMACLSSRVVRGALVKGDLHVSEQRIYGPALVRAVDLEKDHAVYPRIVVDKRVFDLVVEDYKESKVHGGSSLAEYVYIDDDGWPFINYLYAIVDNEDSWLEDHKQLVEKRIDETMGKVRDKYVWMAVYHNTFVGIRDGQASPLLIDLRGVGSSLTRRKMKSISDPD